MRYSLYLPPRPGDVMSLRIDTAGLAAGTIVTIEEIVYKDKVTYARVGTELVDIRKLKKDPGVW